MGWRLRVAHTTQVSYTEPVRASFNEVRMTPLTLPSQVTLESRVTAGPGVPVWTYCDYWGTFVSVFDIGEPHESLTVRAQATVETGQPNGDPGTPPLSWEELWARAPGSRLLEFLLPTPLTTVTPAAAAVVLDTVRDADPAEAAQEIAARVRSQVRYMAGATGVRTNAQEAWDQGEGVCQDMAHVTVALLRAAGLPARYVSGYLHADPAAEPGQTAVGESHAWVEYWAGSWRPLDPTSGAPVRERHVVVARGRDYADIPPLKGIYHGAPASALEVTVEVTRLALFLNRTDLGRCLSSSYSRHVDEKLLTEARQAQERLIDAERDADVARADFHRAVRRLHLNGASLRELAVGLGLSHQRVHQIVESAGGSRRWLRRDRGRPDRTLLCCTFCGKDQTQVKKLIAGPNVYICNGCIDLAKGVIGSGGLVTTGFAELAAGPEQEPRAQCSFCGKHRDQVAGLAVSSAQTGRKTPAAICTECLALCDEIILEEQQAT